MSKESKEYNKQNVIAIALLTSLMLSLLVIGSSANDINPSFTNIPLCNTKYLIYNNSLTNIVSAKNCFTGNIDFSGKNSSIVIQNAINHFTNNIGTIAFVGSNTSVFSLGNGGLIVPNTINGGLVSYGISSFTYTGNGTAFKFSGIFHSGGEQFFSLQNLNFSAPKASVGLNFTNGFPLVLGVLLITGNTTVPVSGSYGVILSPVSATRELFWNELSVQGFDKLIQVNFDHVIIDHLNTANCKTDGIILGPESNQNLAPIDDNIISWHHFQGAGITCINLLFIPHNTQTGITPTLFIDDWWIEKGGGGQITNDYNNAFNSRAARTIFGTINTFGNLFTVAGNFSNLALKPGYAIPVNTGVTTPAIPNVGYGNRVQNTNPFGVLVYQVGESATVEILVGNSGNVTYPDTTTIYLPPQFSIWYNVTKPTSWKWFVVPPMG